MRIPKKLSKNKSRFSLDSKGVQKCDRDGCFHYGEGCGIRYPMEKIPDSLSGLRESGMDSFVNKMLSSEFADFWIEKLGLSHRDDILPCSHSNTIGCTFFICKHLDKKDMMSKEYREYLKNKKAKIKK